MKDLRTWRTRVAAGLLCAITFLVTSCASLFPKGQIVGQVPPPAPLDPAKIDGVFQVGAARVDLTPIPGIPMSYSFDGKISRGFWTRLYARAIYLEDDRGHAIVLVACELAAIPNGLRDRVAELVQKDTNIQHLGRAQIVLAATHTHHGPQNYFSSRYYNSLPSQRAGFDPQLFQFLAERIQAAIAQAWANRKPAADVDYREAKIEHFFRNRSIDAFNLNEDRDALLAESVTVADNCLLVEGEEDRRACRAVRTVVEVLDFRAKPSEAPIASAVFLAAHPTVMSEDTEVFTGDLFGVTAALLEQRRLEGCRDDYAPPVVAIFNGAEGDASITWKEDGRNRLELEDFAERLAKLVCGADPGVAPETEAHADVYKNPSIDSRFEWPFELAIRPVDPAGSGCDPWHEHCTVKGPRAGIVSMGGAQDGRTIWYEAGVQPGLRSAARGRHGRKALGAEAMGLPVEASRDLGPQNPDLEQVPLGVYWIGSLVITTLPGEFTTMMGDRIRKAIATSAVVPDASQKRVLLIGLGNSRVSYVTTPEEFDSQHYEGGQNLFGAATGPAIQQRMDALSKSTSASMTPLEPSYEYDPGPCRVFTPADAGLPAYFPDDGLEDILRNDSGPKRDYPHACWVDAIPKLSKLDDGCKRAVPYVWIEPIASASSTPQCAGMPETFLAQPCDEPAGSLPVDPRLSVGAIPQDNCGTDIVTVLHGSYRDRTRWCAFWIQDPPPDPSDYRFCVAGVTNETIVLAEGATAIPEKPLDGGYGGAVCTALGAGLGMSIQGGLTGAVCSLLDRHLECAGIPTRKVCEFPDDLP